VVVLLVVPAPARVKVTVTPEAPVITPDKLLAARVVPPPPSPPPLPQAVSKMIKEVKEIIESILVNMTASLKV
jgi:hypothetical protein